ncbi:MAG: TIM barrel protein [Hyphomicrobiales bacterium]|nr:TIM barrel protein [Hyphomicrobiales bacterium]
MGAAMNLGNSPCSWGIEFADDPRNPPWEAVLDECASAGFAGIELGPVGFLPEDPLILRDALAARGLTLSGGVVFQPFHDATAWDRVLDAHTRTCRSLASHGAEQLILIDSIAAERTRTLGRPQDAPRLSAEGWAGFSTRIREAATIATEEFGLTASIHAHAGGHCDFEDEHDRLLDEIDESILWVCIDTAHATLAGMDPLALTRRYASRVSHVHLKDIDPVKKAEVVRDGIEFYAACEDDMFCQMGKGEVDFAAFRTLLNEIGYNGWCIVEQDCAPDAAISKVAMARANRDYLASVGF